MVSAVASAALHAGCATPTTVADAKAFRADVGSGDYDAARARMSDHPRRWFEEVQGDGMAWNLGTGPWAAWDEEFNKQTETVGWAGDAHSATLTFRETNDYFIMLERGWVTNEAVYLFDDAGKIRGLLIRAIGDRPPGRTDQFRAWARATEPAEYQYLHPDGEIDPGSDRPARYRALLDRWRKSAGLPAIDG